MYTLKEIAVIIGGKLSGSEELIIEGAAPLKDAEERHIAFADRKHMLEAAQSGAGAVIVPMNSPMLDKPMIRAENPRLAFIKVLQLFQRQGTQPQGIHPAACIGEGVKLGVDVSIRAGAVIENHCIIGSRVVIHPGVYIGEGCKIGDDCVLHPGVVLREGVVLGNRVIIQPNAVIGSDGFGYERDGDAFVKVPHIGTVILEDDVEIGAGTTVDRGTCGETRIGKGTKIDNLVQVAHNVRIGKHCLLAAQNALAGSAELGDYVTMGGQSAVVGHIHVGDQSVVLSCSRVTKSLPPRSMVSGEYGREHSDQLRAIAAYQQLPHLLRRLAALERQLEEARAVTR